MSSFIRRMCTQTGTYWPPSTFNKYGDPSFLTPVALDPTTFTGIRWEDKTTEMITTKTGDQQQSKSVVWSASTKFAVGGFLLLGVSVAADPTVVTGANIILQVSAGISTDGDLFLYKAYL